MAKPTKEQLAVASAVYSMISSAPRNCEEIVEEAARNAGLLWTCRDPDNHPCWTNPSYAKNCENCGRAR